MLSITTIEIGSVQRSSRTVSAHDRTNSNNRPTTPSVVRPRSFVILYFLSVPYQENNVELTELD